MARFFDRLFGKRGGRRHGRAPLIAERLETRTVPSVIPAGPEFRVNAFFACHQWHSAAAMDGDGDFVVVWTSAGQGNVYGRRYDAAGVPQTGEFQVNQVVALDQAHPAVAMDAAGNFVVVWDSFLQDGSFAGVYARRYDAAGTPQGGEFRVNTYTTDSQANPVVAMDADGDFVVAWSSYRQDGSFWGIYAQRYDAAGTPQGGEFRVSTTTAEAQDNAAVAMDADGDFVVAWDSWLQDGSLRGVYAQRFNAAGVPQGGEFRVNTTTAGTQELPAVAMDADGDFVVAWQSWYQDGSFVGTYARRYNAAGVPQSSEFRVNTHTTDSQQTPAVAMDADGDFVVTWASYRQDGSVWGVYAQRYNAAAVPQEGEFLVNTRTTAAQWYPAVAMDADGDFVVAWESYAQDGSGFGVYAQRYKQSQGLLVFGPGAGDPRPVRVLSADAPYTLKYEFYPFGPGFSGGARVAQGDFTGDGIDEILVASGPGIPSELRAYDGASAGPEPTLLASVVFGDLFPGGINLAVGDFSGDGLPDLVFAPDAGQIPFYLAWDVFGGAIFVGLAYEADFLGGVRVALADVSGDGRADLVTGPGAGRAPTVRAFDVATGAVLQSFDAFDPSSTAGVFVASGDVTGDGRAEIVAGQGSGTGSGSVARVFNVSGPTPVQIREIRPYSGYTGEVRVALRDVTGDGVPELITVPGAGSQPRARAFNPVSGAAVAGFDFLVLDAAFTGGLYVA